MLCLLIAAQRPPADEAKAKRSTPLSGTGPEELSVLPITSSNAPDIGMGSKRVLVGTRDEEDLGRRGYPDAAETHFFCFLVDISCEPRWDYIMSGSAGGTHGW
jgi:hypothetical protein